MIRRAPALLLLAAALCPAATGCAPYKLQGRVIQGPESKVTVVDADDPRLEGPAVEEATLRLTLDPLTLGRKVLWHKPVDPDGTFAIPVEKFGAGVLEYEFGVTVRHEGFKPAQRILMLPPNEKRLLITLTEGRDRDVNPEDPLEGARRYLPNRDR